MVEQYLALKFKIEQLEDTCDYLLIDKAEEYIRLRQKIMKYRAMQEKLLDSLVVMVYEEHAGTLAMYDVKDYEKDAVGVLKSIRDEYGLSSIKSIYGTLRDNKHMVHLYRKFND